MTHVNASQKALEKIMKGEVKQRPRWVFVMKNVLLWTFGILSMVAGAIFVSVIIFTMMNSDADLHREMYGYGMSCLTLCTVIVWFVLFAIFVILCDVSVRHTKRGYVYPLRVIVAVHMGMSILFGMVLYASGIGCYVDDLMGMHMRYYYNVEKRRASDFHLPEKGFVMGRVVQRDDRVIEIESPRGDHWLVAVAGIPDKKHIFVQNNDYVIFMGVMNEENIFVACDVKLRQLQGVRFERHIKAYHDALMVQHMQQQQKIIDLVRDLREGSLKPCPEIVHWRVQ